MKLRIEIDLSHEAFNDPESGSFLLRAILKDWASHNLPKLLVEHSSAIIFQEKQIGHAEIINQPGAVERLGK